MKQGNALVNFVMVLLAVALACYLGFYAWDGLTTPFTTTYAYEYIANEGVEAQGFLVREESVFPPQSGIVDLTRGEGEKVGVGQSVALVHKDTHAVAVQEEMDAIAGELALLDHALTQSDSSASSARLDDTILQSLVALRSASSVQDFSQLEEQVMDLKSLVLKRDYTYGQTLDPAGLTARRAQLWGEYQQLKQQSSGATSRVRAGESGIFSALVDGYESLLTPENIFTLTPSQLDEITRARPEKTDSPGKLITSGRWYFVSSIPLADAQQIKKGHTVTVGFTGDFNQEVPMLVEQVGEEENGRCVVILSTDRYLNETTLLRAQSAEIIFASSKGLRVPKTALRMVSKTVTDKASGKEEEVNILGVYAVVGGRAEFKTVEVLSEGGDYYVLKAAGESARALRAGDRIIVRAVDLYDGKLLEY